MTWFAIRKGQHFRLSMDKTGTKGVSVTMNKFTFRDFVIPHLIRMALLCKISGRGKIFVNLNVKQMWENIERTAS